MACCENCGALVDTDDGDAYFKYDEEGNEVYTDEVECSSCQYGDM